MSERIGKVCHGEFHPSGVCKWCEADPVQWTALPVQPPDLLMSFEALGQQALDALWGKSRLIDTAGGRPPPNPVDLDRQLHDLWDSLGQQHATPVQPAGPALAHDFSGFTLRCERCGLALRLVREMEARIGLPSRCRGKPL